MYAHRSCGQSSKNIVAQVIIININMINASTFIVIIIIMMPHRIIINHHHHIIIIISVLLLYINKFHLLRARRDVDLLQAHLSDLRLRQTLSQAVSTGSSTRITRCNFPLDFEGRFLFSLPLRSCKSHECKQQSLRQQCCLICTILF